ncbi:MAG: GDP-mannose 4,6-dehydratase [Pseudomonadota bacterium]
MLYKNKHEQNGSSKTALITGITGQDGTILAEILINKGYDVHGVRPYTVSPDTAHLDHLEGLTLHYGDMVDSGSITRLLEEIKPDEIYNLAGMSHVHVSFDQPELTAQVNALGVTRLLEAIRILDAERDINFYQASSSEMFGRSVAPQNEQTAFQPCSPYGVSKLYAYWSVRNSRDAYDMHASNGILFNHESAIRGEEFVTRKITKAIGRIEVGEDIVLTLGNLDAERDWGHARDYMEGAYLMLQQEEADDYVLATGESYTVRDFVTRAFAVIGKEIIWDGEDEHEIGVDKKTGQKLIQINPELFRPQEIKALIGDASKARDVLGWQPKVSFEALVEEMVQSDRIITKAYRQANAH